MDCHACEPVRPVEAIFYEDDLPQQWARYKAINAEYFESPTGSRNETFAKGDHPAIAALPPQSSQKNDIAVFAIRKEEAADADLWFPL